MGLWVFCCIAQKRPRVGPHYIKQLNASPVPSGSKHTKAFRIASSAPQPVIFSSKIVGNMAELISPFTWDSISLWYSSVGSFTSDQNISSMSVWSIIPPFVESIIEKASLNSLICTTFPTARFLGSFPFLRNHWDKKHPSIFRCCFGYSNC